MLNLIIALLPIFPVTMVSVSTDRVKKYLEPREVVIEQTTKTTIKKVLYKKTPTNWTKKAKNSI